MFNFIRLFKTLYPHFPVQVLIGTSISEDKGKHYITSNQCKNPKKHTPPLVTFLTHSDTFLSLLSRGVHTTSSHRMGWLKSRFSGIGKDKSGKLEDNLNKRHNRLAWETIYNCTASHKLFFRVRKIAASYGPVQTSYGDQLWFHSQKNGKLLGTSNGRTFCRHTVIRSWSHPVLSWNRRSILYNIRFSGLLRYKFQKSHVKMMLLLNNTFRRFFICPPLESINSYKP